MNTNKITVNDKTYILRLIDDNEFEEVLELFQLCPDYFEMVEGSEASETSVVNYFEALPPDKTLEDKYSIGIYEGGLLVGVVDLVKDFPEVGTWIVGLVIIKPAYRRIGLGTAIYHYIGEIAKQEEVSTLRVGVLTCNEGALLFTKSLGYQEAFKTDEAIAYTLDIKES